MLLTRVNESASNEKQSLARLLSIVFLTCLLDIVSLTIAIPILPFLLEFYLTPTGGGESGPFNWVLVKLLSVAGVEKGGMQSALLASGVLALVFSTAQFLTAPIWGRLSDRFGRKSILLWTVAGAFFAQCLWFFGASLELFILMRFIAGSMAGNISVATAAIADSVSGAKRARAMTVIGLSYGIGYMLGPLLGGMTAQWDILELLPGAAAYGLHPFSLTAGVAAFLALINWVLLKYLFKDTLSEENRDRSVQIDFRLLGSLAAKVQDTDLRRIFSANFFFFAAFISCEFNIVFLAIDRFQFSAIQNAYMYTTIGFMQIVAQCFVLPPILRWTDEKVVTICGFSILALGILGCAVCSSGLQLYLACGAMSLGSSLVFPCLTGLISRKSAADVQGQVLGIFRSRGDLGTAIGPLMQSLLYFQTNSFWAFFLFGLALMIPLYLVSKVSLGGPSATAEFTGK